jgi:hypothetical protein
VQIFGHLVLQNFLTLSTQPKLTIMKWLKRILYFLLSVIVLMLLISFFLPAQKTIVRSAVIKADPTKVQAVLSDLKTYNSWMTWNQKDPNMKVEYGTTSGVGASYKWKSDNWQVGEGALRITKSTPEEVGMELLMDGESPAPATWALSPKDGGTNIVWKMDMQMGGNPIKKWFGLMMEGVMGGEFDKSLAQMKDFIESGKYQPPVEVNVSKPDSLKQTKDSMMLKK